MEKYLIVGLGNPGSRYANTRHNVGFKIVERMAERLNFSFRAGRGNYDMASGPAHAEVKGDLLLVKPLTYMNNSGLAVRHAVDYYGIALSNTLIIFDDFQLPLGKLRLRSRGSDGGHNGMASVIQHLGTQAVPRLRFGIGSEFAKGEPVNHVLSSFAKAEQELLPELYDRAAGAAFSFVDEGIQQAMNRFN